MLTLEFSDEITEILNYERHHHFHPRVRQKMGVLYLKSQGFSHKSISKIEHICENTLLHYLRDYEKGGIEEVKAIRFRKPQSELQPHADTILNYFREYPPATLNEAVAKIEELTGIKKSREPVRVFLKKLGLAPRKVGMIPGKADVDAQKEFVNQKLNPRIEEAKAGNRSLFL